MMQRKAFLDQEAPPGYVAGLGRGATGFTTQAEWGAIQPLPVVTLNGANTEEDREDIEADAIFDSVERQLNEKRGKKRVRNDAESNGKSKDVNENENQKIVVEDISVGDSIKAISNKFQDVKRNLKSVSLEEWVNLPEPVDLTMRNKRLREERKTQQRFYRNALSLNLLTDGATDETIEVGGGEEEELSRAKDLILESQLKSKEDNLGIHTIDKQQYLRELTKSNDGVDESTEPKKFINNIGDYQKTRSLFSKLIQTNPRKPENWIAYARLEYDAKKYNKSRSIIQEGCEQCPKNEEIWLVNLELNMSNVNACKVIVADSIKYNKTSIKLWTKAIELENDSLSKTRVIRKALEFSPKNETLWLQLVENEPNESIKIKILEKATQLAPSSLKLWLKLVELEESQKALIILSEARSHVKREDHYILWVTQAKLQERIDQNEAKIERVIRKCFEEIGNSLLYEKWIEQANECDQEGFPLTTRSLILNTLKQFEPHDIEQLNTDAKIARKKESPHYEVARSILLYINEKYPQDLDAWFQSLGLEKELKELDRLYLTYELALKAQPGVINLYLMYAKDKWLLNNDVEKARSVLFEGMQLNPQNEDLWFAAIKLEDQAGSELVALDLFDQCKSALENPSARVWYKHVTLERKLGRNEQALDLISKGLELFPHEPKLYLQRGQIYEDLNDFEKAKVSYELGTKQCSQNPYIWIHLAKLYQLRLNKIIKARSTLDEAISKIPQSEILHCAKVGLESNNKQQCLKLLSRALQMIPNSGLLWSRQIKMVSDNEKKTMYAMALKSTKDNPNVILTIAIDLWKKGEIQKAKIFFQSCLKKNPNFGDVYIYFYAYLLQNGEMDQMKDLEYNFLRNDPHDGLEWCLIIKSIDNMDIEPLTLLRESAVKAMTDVFN